MYPPTRQQNNLCVYRYVYACNIGNLLSPYNRHNMLSMQIPAVHIVGNLVWFHSDFLLRHLRAYMTKVIDKKLIEQMRSFRQQYLTQRSGQDLARSVRDSNSNQDWIAFNVVANFIGVEH